MDDYDFVIIREPVCFDLTLFIMVLLGSYVLAIAAMLFRIYLRVGKRRR